MDRSKIITKVIENMEREYRTLWKDFAKNSTTGGKARKGAGDLVESLLQVIFDTINSQLSAENKIISRIGSTDNLTKRIEYKGKIHTPRAHVDRHIWQLGKRIAFIENKTYLDSCYYTRALADFRNIAQALKQSNVDPADVSYIVFAGQKAANEDTLLAYEADFWHITKDLTKNPEGIVPHIFYFLQKTRISQHPWNENQFPLNHDDINKFVTHLLDLLS